MDLDQWGQPIIINAIGNMQVEIRMDEGPDEESLMQDAYDQIKDDQTVPFQVKLEFMPISAQKKKRIQALLQQPPNPLLVQKAQLDNQRTAAEIEEKAAGTQHRRAQALETVAAARLKAAQAHATLGSIDRDDARTQHDLAMPVQQPGADQGNGSQPQPPPAPTTAIPRRPLYSGRHLTPIMHAPAQYGSALRSLLPAI
jgi:hypothetical protein